MDVDQVPFVRTMKQLHKENKLDSIQSIFFGKKRPVQELYDLKQDPFELNNQAENPKYIEILKEHVEILENWIKETDDKGAYGKRRV